MQKQPLTVEHLLRTKKKRLLLEPPAGCARIEASPKRKIRPAVTVDVADGYGIGALAPEKLSTVPKETAPVVKPHFVGLVVLQCLSVRLCVTHKRVQVAIAIDIAEGDSLATTHA